ncbi:MAG: CoA transferase [Thermodesulfobacteriota bacterium]
MSGALEGIRVVDLGHVLAAPTATMFLADLGAEVIHIESSKGDDAREYGPFIKEPDKNRSGYFISLNRNKKSMVLNLKHELGKKILRELIVKSDVLVENFRPTTMKKLGFGWEEIQKINPAMIYASVSGFGHDAPAEYAARPAYDMVVQAYSGMMSITGPPDGPPCRAGSSIGDIFAGHQAAIGILAALIHRAKTGRGQYYDGSMLDGLFAVMESAISRYTIEGVIPGPLGSAHPSISPFQAFQTRDAWIVVAIGNDAMWSKFCKIIEREDLTSDPRFYSNPARTENIKTLAGIIQDEIGKRTTAQWSDIFKEAGLPYSPINNMEQICQDPIVRHRNMLVEVDQPTAGKVTIAGSPIHLSETPGKVYAPAPLLGEHSEEILREILGYSRREIDRLLAEGVVNS